MARKLCLAVLILASLCFPAWAQQRVCFPLETIDADIQNGGEMAPSVEMVQRDGSIIRIYANIQAGTWLLFIITGPDATEACMFSHGTQFNRYPSRIGRGV
jgi:hypothetical protein